MSVLSLVHRTKSGGESEIPLDATAALLNSHFHTRTVRRPGEKEVTLEALEWKLPVDPTHEGRFKGHQYTLVFTLDAIAMWKKAIAAAEKRAAEAGL